MLTILLQVVLLLAGFAMLVKGADWFVDGACGIASRFGIPQLVIGLTIVAMGTSAPETAVSLTAALKGSADMSIGNVVGSNIMNVLVILGATSAIRALHVGLSTIKYEIPFVILISIVLLVEGLDGTVSFIDALVLIALFAVYLFYLFKLAKAGKTETEEIKQLSLPKAVALTLIGLVLIVLGSNVSVDAATELARIFGLSERIIGLTIVALGTSLPELVTSVTAALKGNADIAIGNVVGSDIFNILFVLGITGTIVPIPFAPAFITDMIIATGTVILLFILAFRKKELNRAAGIIMLLCYAGYFVYTLK
ncbi:cation:H+ antiporter [Lachnospiraceae bacterium]|nr:cation:H+ antiporter [Lachnospiraceae bacterium]